MLFNKPARSTQEHIELLRKRGLEFSESDRSAYYLENIGYYRLTGYMYPFQEASGNHNFHQGTTFKQVLDHYIFDKKLRFMVLEVLERIEVSVRTNISNTYALDHGAHWHMDLSHFSDAIRHTRFIEDTKSRCSNSNERFIVAYRNKYSRPELPPSWMVFETISFGAVASVYENLKGCDKKTEIARKFGTVPPILESWLKSMLFVRNTCAHHSRLWNRKIPLKPTIPVRKGKRFLEHVDASTNKALYGILSCIVFALQNINPTSSFKVRLKNLFNEYPEVNISWMGFPPNWEEEAIWAE